MVFMMIGYLRRFQIKLIVPYFTLISKNKKGKAYTPYPQSGHIEDMI
jgi:hypothetical protein